MRTVRLVLALLWVAASFVGAQSQAASCAHAGDGATDAGSATAAAPHAMHHAAFPDEEQDAWACEHGCQDDGCACDGVAPVAVAVMPSGPSLPQHAAAVDYLFLRAVAPGAVVGSEGPPPRRR